MSESSVSTEVCRARFATCADAIMPAERRYRPIRSRCADVPEGSLMPSEECRRDPRAYRSRASAANRSRSMRV